MSCFCTVQIKFETTRFFDGDELKQSLVRTNENMIASLSFYDIAPYRKDGSVENAVYEAMHRWITPRWHHRALASIDATFDSTPLKELYVLETRMPLPSRIKDIKNVMLARIGNEYLPYLCKVNPTLSNMARQLLYYIGHNTEYLSPGVADVFSATIQCGAFSSTVDREYIPVFNPS